MSKCEVIGLGIRCETTTERKRNYEFMLDWLERLGVQGGGDERILYIVLRYAILYCRCSADAGEGQESKYVDVHNNF